MFTHDRGPAGGMVIEEIASHSVYVPLKVAMIGCPESRAEPSRIAVEMVIPPLPPCSGSTGDDRASAHWLFLHLISTAECLSCHGSIGRSSAGPEPHAARSLPASTWRALAACRRPTRRHGWSRHRLRRH